MRAKCERGVLYLEIYIDMQVEGMSTSICDDQQESMETGSTHQEGGPDTPMDDSVSQENDQSANISAASYEGDEDESGENVPYDKLWVDNVYVTEVQCTST